MKAVEARLKSFLNFSDDSLNSYEWNGVLFIDEEKQTIEGIGSENILHGNSLGNNKYTVKDDTYIAGYMDDSIIILLKLSNTAVNSRGILVQIPEKGLKISRDLVGRWTFNSRFYVQLIGKTVITFGQVITDKQIINEARETIVIFKINADNDQYSLNCHDIREWWDGDYQDEVLREAHEEIENFGIFKNEILSF